MRIGIDMSSLSSNKTGVDYYVTNLVKAFGTVDNVDTYVLYLREKYFNDFSDLGNNFIKKT